MPKRRALEKPGGLFAALPHRVMDSIAYQSLSAHAKAVLLELLRQHNGANNGHLHCARAYMFNRSMRSASGNTKALRELCDRGLAVLTKKGGRSIGPDRYALTWLPISTWRDAHGQSLLDLRQSEFSMNAYVLFKGARPTSSRAESAAKASEAKRQKARSTAKPLDRPTVQTRPSHGPASQLAGPSHGPKTTETGASSGPSDGHIAYATCPPVTAGAVGGEDD